MKPQTVWEAAMEENCWTAFLEEKVNKQHLTRYEEHQFRDFIKRKAFLGICEAWSRGEFPGELPVKQIINKAGTSKKRVVYTFEGDAGLFLKFVSSQMHRYDRKFAPNCYAFRQNIGVKEAISRIRRIKGIEGKYCLKLDVSNYFNSISVDLLLSKLAFLKEEDEMLYRLCEKILLEKRVRLLGKDGERIQEEEHGAMAGIPLSAFFANLYLSEMDHHFYQKHVMYFRYSDDILVFADSREELLQIRQEIEEILSRAHLSLNPEKVLMAAPGEVWEFLGFSFEQGRMDLSANTLRKMKAKIKRKADALRRWQRKKGLPPEKAAVGLIKAMNRKFYGTEPAEQEPGEEKAARDTSDFTWSKWFFPNINTDRRLKELDAYFQEYIRYAVTGRHYKGNYRITYEQMKEWGYRSLVHEYYQGLAEEK